MNEKVSIGVFAYNEEKLIEKCINSILNQNLVSCKIGEILVFSDGSTDKTNQILKKILYSVQKKKIDFEFKVFFDKKRKGKAYRINQFLKKVRFKYLIISSADIIWEKNTLENLVVPLRNKDVGIVTSHPIPKINPKTFIGKIVDLQWNLHHLISLQKPKFGELIAFKNVISQIPLTSVDEEVIASEIKKRGFKAFYAKDAVVYNFGPKTIKDFIKQRRRIFCGHFELLRTKQVLVSSLDLKLLFKAILITLRSNYNLLVILSAAFLELISRVLGFYDYFTNKEKHYKWEKIKR